LETTRADKPEGGKNRKSFHGKSASLYQGNSPSKKELSKGPCGGGGARAGRRECIETLRGKLRSTLSEQEVIRPSRRGGKRIKKGKEIGLVGEFHSPRARGCLNADGLAEGRGNRLRGRSRDLSCESYLNLRPYLESGERTATSKVWGGGRAILP